MERESERRNFFSRSFNEGGYTFLKRVLEEAQKTKAPVLMNVGKLYLEYTFSPDQENFMQGINIISGDDEESLNIFKGVAESYDVQRGSSELQQGI